jgi:hypothetical protein
MSPDPARLRRPITEFNFKPLFVEELGWDDVRTAPLIVYVNDQPFTLKALAQKRGLLLHCPAMPAELGIGDPRAAFAYNLLAVAVRRLPTRWVSFTMARSQPILADLPMLSNPNRAVSCTIGADAT